MKSKENNEKSPPEANIFNSNCHSRAQLINGIVNEIEIGVKRARRRRNFLTEFVTVCTQIMNGIVNEIEIQKNDKSPPQANFFYRICHNLHTNNEGIVNEI